MAEIGREAIHEAPIWRDRSDFIIAAETGDEATPSEQLWARRIDEYRFEICCIPFFVYDLALGDVVETDVAYVIKAVVEPSGRFVFRVWFGDSFHPRDEIAEQIIELGALLEWSSTNLLAVDTVDEALAQTVADALHEHEQLGHLVYETGKSA